MIKPIPAMLSEMEEKNSKGLTEGGCLALYGEGAFAIPIPPAPFFKDGSEGRYREKTQRGRGSGACGKKT